MDEDLAEKEAEDLFKVYTYDVHTTVATCYYEYIYNSGWRKEMGNR